MGTKVAEETLKGPETLVETVGTPEVGDEAKVKYVVTSEAVVGPEGEVEALVSLEPMEVNMVGPDAEKETMVPLEDVVEIVGVSADVGIIVVTDSPSVTKILVDSVIASETMVKATVLQREQSRS